MDTVPSADLQAELHPEPTDLLGDQLLKILEGLPDDRSFVRPDQGDPELRDWPDDLGPNAITSAS